MNTKILVTYATKHGATAEIAEKIGQVIHQAGLPVTILPVERVTDLNQYSAVIIGSAIYIGQWQKKATRFLKDNEDTLAQKLVWLFSSGPTGFGDPVELADGWHFPEILESTVEQIQPKDIMLFSGELNTEKLNFLEKWMTRTVKAPVGDFRDWHAITAWARTIVDVLQTEVLMGVPTAA